MNGAHHAMVLDTIKIENGVEEFLFKNLYKNRKQVSVRSTIFIWAAIDECKSDISFTACIKWILLFLVF